MCGGKVTSGKMCLLCHIHTPHTHNLTLSSERESQSFQLVTLVMRVVAARKCRQHALEVAAIFNEGNQ